MILDEYVEIGIGGKNSKYYEAKGYVIPRKTDSKGRVNFTKGSKIIVKVADLMPTSKVKVLCKCESCGNERYVHYDTLAYRFDSIWKESGETLCVKCRNHTYCGMNNSQYKHGNNRYAEYRCNAKRRGLVFELTIEQFEEITAQPCHYCGGKSSDYDEKSRGNGIDRKNSDIGYKYFNCVPCCSKCNFLKNNTDYKDFINYIKRVYEVVNKYEI